VLHDARTVSFSACELPLTHFRENPGCIADNLRVNYSLPLSSFHKELISLCLVIEMNDGDLNSLIYPCFQQRYLTIRY